VSVKKTYKGSANSDCSMEDVGGKEKEEERIGGREKDNDHLTPVDSIHSSVEAERNGPEPQSPASGPINAPSTVRSSAQKTPQDAAFDACQEIRYTSESEGREARSTRTDGNEERSMTANPPAPSKQLKRKSSELGADVWEPKSKRKEVSKAPEKSRSASKVGSKARDKSYSPQKPLESFSDLTGFLQKVFVIQVTQGVGHGCHESIDDAKLWW
jgi:hypothetical protein